MWNVTRVHISACDCDINGSTDHCSEGDGQCTCHVGYEGPRCNICSDGYEKRDQSGECLAILPCPDGWKEMHGKCFKVGDGKSTFELAKSKCLAMGGYMVEPLTAAEDSAIKELNNEYGQAYHWIGLNDQAEELK